jgi:hypothetical protein
LKPERVVACLLPLVSSIFFVPADSLHRLLLSFIPYLVSGF